MLSAAGSYKAYEFTDTVQFCGQTCHTVMHPEFTAYQFSPHARVTCVECHGHVERVRHTPRAPTFEMGWCLTCHRERGASEDCWTCHK